MKIPRTIISSSWIVPTALLIIVLLGMGKPIQSALYTASAKTQGALWNTYANLSLFVKSVPRAVSILREYETLTKERELYERSLIALEATQEENDALRQTLSLQKNISFQHIVAEPIGLEIANNVLIVNKGKLQGIKPGMPVITPSLALIGTVVETEPATSRIMLISHPNSSLDGSIPQKNISGVLKGQGSDTLLFDLISRDAEIETGDIVITNRFSASIPNYLALGTVTRVARDDASPFLRAFARPAYGAQRIDVPVFILRVVPQVP